MAPKTILSELQLDLTLLRLYLILKLRFVDTVFIFED